MEYKILFIPLAMAFITICAGQCWDEKPMHDLCPLATIFTTNVGTIVDCKTSCEIFPGCKGIVFINTTCYLKPTGCVMRQDVTEGITAALLSDCPRGQDSTGPQDSNGPQGPQGDTGPQGLVGFNGRDGVPGRIGATGGPGNSGRTGATGSPGSPGLPGVNGNSGPQGSTGRQGKTGLRGYTGPQGNSGRRGDPGFTGPTGKQGDTGAAGPQGQTGPAGPLAIRDCATNNGLCEHTCTVFLGEVMCSCQSGFLLLDDEKSCQDIDECKEEGDKACGENSVCHNDLGSHTCSCQPGYILKGKLCTDVNGCSTSNGGCWHTCTQTPGSFSCKCDTGYTLALDKKSCYGESIRLTWRSGKKWVDKKYKKSSLSAYKTFVSGLLVKLSVCRREYVCKVGLYKSKGYVGVRLDLWMESKKDVNKDILQNLIGQDIGKKPAVKNANGDEEYYYETGPVQLYEEVNGKLISLSNPCRRHTEERLCQFGSQCIVVDDRPICNCSAASSGEYCEKIELLDNIKQLLGGVEKSLDEVEANTSNNQLKNIAVFVIASCALIAAIIAIIWNVANRRSKTKTCPAMDKESPLSLHIQGKQLPFAKQHYPSNGV